MKKVFLNVAAAALIAGAALTGSAIAQSRSDGTAALTANQIVAEADAQTARIKADLLLTPDQEKNWPGFESAVHAISKSRADRQIAFQAQRGRTESGDIIQYLTSRAKLLGESSADVKKLADAAQPLYASLDEHQKKRFAKALVELSGIDRD